MWGSRLLGWETIGYVEKDKYCQQVIAQRIKDGWFHEAPIFGDINAFLDQGYARRYRGMVDIITAGFPCQPFSVAGVQRGADDPRNKWPETIECIRQIRPPLALLENVPRLATHKYFQTILGDLAEAGFDATYDFVSAKGVGADHLRKRLWILCVHPDAFRERFKKLNVSEVTTHKATRDFRNRDLVGTGHESRKAWSVCKPGVVGMDDDVAHRIDRVRASGNGQVGIAMVHAVKTLANDLDTGGSLAMTDYQSFIQRKHVRHESQGFDVAADELNANLFNWQSGIARFSLRKGRSALFADCGLGKTIMQLSWADAVVKRTGKPVLILCPIAVASQTCNEASRFKIDTPMINVRKDGQSGKPSIQIVNYDAIHKLNLSIYGGVALDESSILKNFTGKIKQQLCSSFAATPYRLACTATPSPNDIMELCNHAEFLGIMDRDVVLSRWFTHDGGDTSKWRLKKHGEADFWRWVSSWAVCISKPSDIGGDDEGYVLPELKVTTHYVTPGTPPPGHLFDKGGKLSAINVHKEKRRSLGQKAELIASLVNTSDEQWALWVDTDYESDALKAVVRDCVEIRGSTADHIKESRLDGFACGRHRNIITKPKLTGFGVNWQHCHNTACVVGYSFEQYYQLVRRFWRFGQEHPVNVHLFASDAEAAIVDTLQRKSQQHHEMTSAMASAMRDGMLEELYGNEKSLQAYRPAKAFSIPQFITQG